MMIFSDELQGVVRQLKECSCRRFSIHGRGLLPDPAPWLRADDCVYLYQFLLGTGPVRTVWHHLDPGGFIRVVAE